MLKVFTLVCALLALLIAVVNELWLRSKRGHDAESVRTYGILRRRNANFRIFQYPSLILIVIIMCVAIGLSIGWKRAAVFTAAAAICCVVVLLASVSYTSGASSSSSSAFAGDLKVSLNSSYRTGVAAGFLACCAGIFVLVAMFLLFKTKSVVSNAPYLALGFACPAAILNTGGNIYTASYDLASSSKDFTDTSGSFVASVADRFSSYILAACAVIMLSEAGVNSSGVTSTFSQSSAAKYVLAVYAAGVIASFIGCLFYRGNTKNDPSHGSILTLIIPGLLTIGASWYLSNQMLESPVYAWAAACGIVAGIILIIYARLYSADGKILMSHSQSDRKLGTHSQVIFNMGSGLVSVFVYALIIGTAITIAYQYANIYGVAIAGAGLTAVTGASAAVSSLSIISATSASILNAADDDINDNTADILDTCSIRARSSANAFTVTASAITAFALYFAYSNAAEQHTVDILNPKVILSLMLGAGTALLLYGLTIVAVRVTGRVALRDLDRSDETEGTTSSLRGSLLPTILTIIFPLIAGLLLGKGGLSAYLAGALITGTFLMISSNDSGQHFEHTAVNTLGPIIKVMIAVAIAFLPLFTKMGSFIF